MLLDTCDTNCLLSCLIWNLHQYMFISSSHKRHISLMALEAAHFLPNNILFLLYFFHDHLCKCCCFVFSIEFPFFCCCFTSFNLAFIFTGESCVSLRMFLNFPIQASAFSAHLAHAMQSKANGKIFVWICVLTDCLLLASNGFCTCSMVSFFPSHALFLHLRLYSLFYPSILERFVIKHFSQNILQFRMIVTFVSSGCRQ